MLASCCRCPVSHLAGHLGDPERCTTEQYQLFCALPSVPPDWRLTAPLRACLASLRPPALCVRDPLKNCPFLASQFGGVALARRPCGRAALPPPKHGADLEIIACAQFRPLFISQEGLIILAAASSQRPRRKNGTLPTIKCWKKTTAAQGHRNTKVWNETPLTQSSWRKTD